ncbi:MAG: gliding motility-associated C-terminal domain-containing protein [Prevotellaceae bacterium]|jgi:gliding motility-associated-like protein|nr:gliding motility-associated C-terminal domain-containing protein [Prevotellaceae bacterium]
MLISQCAIVDLDDVLESAASYYITVTDDKGCTLLNASEVTIGVVKLEITPDKLPLYRKTIDYDQQLESNADVPLFTITEGCLPVGLTLSNSGRIYGNVPATERNMDILFTVQVEDENRCTATRDYVISSDFSVLRLFTPNGDGINDIFMIGYKLIIFDRLGVTIFKGDNGWDGSYKGNPATSDIYFYKLHYENKAGEAKIKTGYIGLEREN